MSPTPYNITRRRQAALDDTVDMPAIHLLRDVGDPDTTGQDRRIEDREPPWPRVIRGITITRYNQSTRQHYQVTLRRDRYTLAEATSASSDAEGAALTLALMQSRERVAALSRLAPAGHRPVAGRHRLRKAAG